MNKKEKIITQAVLIAVAFFALLIGVIIDDMRDKREAIYLTSPITITITENR